MKKFFNEFKTFCTKGNILELATGVMIGGAFTTIVNSLVNDMLMPVIGLVTGGVNLSGLFIALDGQQYVSIDAAKEAGVGTLNYGEDNIHIQPAILGEFPHLDGLGMGGGTILCHHGFVKVMLFLFVKFMTKLMPKKEAAPAKPARLCPYCKQPVHDEAVKCQHCASDIAGK